MKLAPLLLSTLFFSHLAEAALPRIAPSPDAPTCFKREYTEEHMRQNPGQKLEEMYVKLGIRNEKNDEYSWTWTAGEVVGVSRGEYYGNTAGCTVKRDGSVNCSVDCDGGSFDLRHSPRYAGAVNFLVTKDYYFPLFKNRMSRDDENFESEESLSLDNDANRIYRLVPVNVRECNEAIQKITGDSMGGC